MKNKLLILVLICITSLSLTACGGTNTPPREPPSTSGERVTPDASNNLNERNVTGESSELSESPAPAGENKALVVYFSRVGVTSFDDSVDAVSTATLNIRDGKLTGNMEILAGYIVEATGADLFQIITEKEYPLNYHETTNVARAEQDAGERPALSSHVDNMEQYDTVYIGYPNWWGTIPQAVFTFLEEYDFSGKTIVPFCSHEGSGLGHGPRDIAESCPEAIMLDGFSVRGRNVSGAREDINNWLSGLGLL